MYRLPRLRFLLLSPGSSSRASSRYYFQRRYRARVRLRVERDSNPRCARSITRLSNDFAAVAVRIFRQRRRVVPRERTDRFRRYERYKCDFNSALLIGSDNRIDTETGDQIGFRYRWCPRRENKRRQDDVSGKNRDLPRAMEDRWISWHATGNVTMRSRVLVCRVKRIHVSVIYEQLLKYKYIYICVWIYIDIY